MLWAGEVTALSVEQGGVGDNPMVDINSTKSLDFCHTAVTLAPCALCPPFLPCLSSRSAIHEMPKHNQVPTPPDANGEQDEAIMSAIAAKTKALPPPTAAQEAGALRAGQPICAGLRLTAAQRETVDKIHAAVSLDFALRRRMLLRRCDVTVQSFLRDRGDSASSAKIAAAAGKEMGDAGGQRNDLGILPEPLKVLDKKRVVFWGGCSGVCDALGVWHVTCAKKGFSSGFVRVTVRCRVMPRGRTVRVRARACMFVFCCAL